MFCEEIHSALESVNNAYDPKQVCVVIDSNVKWESTFPTLRIDVSEAAKSLETLTQIWDFLLAQGMTRRGLLVCIGGGILTDIGGMAAATYKRGIDYITVPTTLLAMVDASTGGKTGINYHGLKNAIGVFAAPKATLIWPQWLQTLPAQQFLSGFGEMLKTGLIAYRKEQLWEALLQYDLGVADIPELTPMIEACVRVKEHIVAQDPHEEGLRKVLNFGHTFGHAIEEMALGTIPHGYAVVYGLIAELYLSVTKLGCPKEPLQHLTQLMLRYYDRPTCKCSDRERLIAFMKQDKKNEHTAQINCTLLHSVGQPAINQVITETEAKEAMDYLFSL